METRPPEVIANIAICLIHQTNYLIDQQLRRLEKDFLKQGGLRERMTRALACEPERTRANDGHPDQKDETAWLSPAMVPSASCASRSAAMSLQTSTDEANAA